MILVRIMRFVFTECLYCRGEMGASETQANITGVIVKLWTIDLYNSLICPSFPRIHILGIIFYQRIIDIIFLSMIWIDDSTINRSSAM